MKSLIVLITACAFLLLNENSAAQLSQPQQVGSGIYYPINGNPLDAMRNRSSQSNQRGSHPNETAIFIDYAGANGDNQALAAFMNMNFIQQDTVGDRYATVAFDSLHDATTDIGYNYSFFDSIRIDSLFFAMGHKNNSGLPDTLVVKLIQIGNNGYPTGVVLWSTQIVSTILTGQPGWLNFITAFVAPGITLPPTMKFGMQLEYTGPKVDTFGYLYSFVDKGPCVNLGQSFSAEFSNFWPNSYRFNVFNNQLLPTAPPNSLDLFWDCDGDGSPETANLVQNINYVAKVTGFTGGGIPQAKIRLLRVNPTTNEITIANYGNATQNIANYQVCTKFTYSPLLSLTTVAGSLNLAAGDTVKISGFAIDAAGADLGLYRTTAFSDTAAMVDFTQWLTAGNGREPVAVAKGIWGVGDFVSDLAPYKYIGNGFQDGVTFWEGTMPPVCVPPVATGTPGLSPGYTNFSCVEQGVFFDEVINLENFTTLGGVFTVNSLRIDSITNLPCNLSWASNKANNIFGSGETGCIRISGTSNDSVGQYQLGIWVTVDVGFPFSGTLCDLTNLVGGIPGFDCNYYVRVKTSATACAAVDTSLISNVACIGLAGPTNCDTLANFNPDDTLRIYLNPTGGYIAGHNLFLDMSKADFFTNNAANAQVTGAFLLFGVAEFANANSTITVAVWDNGGANGSPGNMVTSENILISSIAPAVNAGLLTYVNFTNPAVVNSDFYVGITFTYASGDTVALYTNSIGDNTNTAWEEWDGGGWFAYTDTVAPSWGIDVSHIIQPILCIDDTCPILNVSVDSMDASCGSTSGVAIATASQGMAPYTYNWSNAQNGDTISNLTPGNYAVTATDANGCTGTASVTVNDALIILSVATSSTDNTACFSANGTATASASGGAGNYGYQWDVNTGNQTGPTATGLVAGEYSVSAFDANGCSGSDTVTVTDNVLTLTVTVVGTVPNNSCSNPIGSATVTASGGTGSYIYQWDAAANNQTTATASTLQGGMYTVTATDTNGCTGTVTATVATSTPTIGFSFNVSANTSCANPDGSATATASGGVTPYIYQWDNNANSQLGPIASNLAAGTYAVTAVDMNGCPGTDTVVIADNTPVITFTKSSNPNTSCNGNGNGSATVTPSGGIAPYSYQWDANAGNQTNDTAINLLDNTYSVTVSDANTCNAITTVTVINNLPNIGLITSSTNDTSCVNASGTATVVASGGALPYNYQWDANAGNQTNATAINLSGGGYTVTVTDANGCADDRVVTVSASIPVINILPNTVDASCNGGADGSINLTVTPSGNYNYLWNDNNTDRNRTGLSAGMYAVTATDNNGCSNNINVNVNEPSVLSVTTSFTDESAVGENDGTATASGTGGSPTYSYNWTGGLIGPSVTNLAPGTYTVTITDANGCISTNTGDVGVGVGIEDINDLISFSIQPNPTNGAVAIILKLNYNKKISIDWYNLLGKKIIRSEEFNTNLISKSYDLSGQAEGIYFARITIDGQTIIRKVVLTK